MLSYTERREMRLQEYLVGAIVAIGILRCCVRLGVALDSYANGYLPSVMERAGLSLADLGKLTRHKHAEGPVCWILSDVRPLEVPIAAKGAQGLWVWDANNKRHRN